MYISTQQNAELYKTNCRIFLHCYTVTQMKRVPSNILRNLHYVTISHVFQYHFHFALTGWAQNVYKKVYTCPRVSLNRGMETYQNTKRIFMFFEINTT